MPLRVPALPSIGTDIVRISRLAKYACASAALPFAKRFLTPRELAVFAAADITDSRRVEFLASRWAAKEAVIKAVPRRIYHRDVEVYSMAGGAPFAVVLDDRHGDARVTGRGPALIARPEQLVGLRGAVVGLSITHEDEFAVAVAIADPRAFEAG